MPRINAKDSLSWQEDERAVTRTRLTAVNAIREEERQRALRVATIATALVALLMALVALRVANNVADKLPASGQTCIKANYQGQLYVGMCN